MSANDRRSREFYLRTQKFRPKRNSNPDLSDAAAVLTVELLGQMGAGRYVGLETVDDDKCGFESRPDPIAITEVAQITARIMH